MARLLDGSAAQREEASAIGDERDSVPKSAADIQAPHSTFGETVSSSSSSKLSESINTWRVPLMPKAVFAVALGVVVLRMKLLGVVLLEVVVLGVDVLEVVVLG